MALSFKEKLLLTLKEADAFTTKLLAHRLSISKAHYPLFYTSIDRLEKKGIIKKKKRGKFVLLSITPKGKAILNKPSMPKIRHDGLSTIITFDIPEEKDKARRALRRYLISHGYTLLQESILISPNHASQELMDLIKELDIYSCVKIIAGRIEYR